MPTSAYLPIFELTRGKTVESIHFGAVAVVDVHGNLLAWFGDVNVVTFLRSAAKPFQAVPFLEYGGQEAYNLSLREIAILCASHSGTDEHVSVVKAIQAKTGVEEKELLCGTHQPFHEPTAEAMRGRKEQPTPNRHNCSGKHTGMLAYVHLKERLGESLAVDMPYIDPLHPVQKEILQTFSEISGVPVDRVEIGIDGCSAPNFAIPLWNAALAFVRLCDPEEGGLAPRGRIDACRLITSAMMANPEMVGGPGRFDTCLMEVGEGHILSKGGAEAFQGIGLTPGALGCGSPSIGIALKISDGDQRKKVCNAVSLEVLRQLDILTAEELDALSDFGPVLDLYNWQRMVVGEARPVFNLQRSRKIKSK